MLIDLFLLVLFVAQSDIEDPYLDVGGDSSHVQYPMQSKSAAMPSQGMRDAIIGLKWGWSPADVKKSNNKIKLAHCFGEICRYEMRSPPKGMGWAESCDLIFRSNSLVGVRLFRKIENDLFGSEGKSRFAAIDSSLSLKYTQEDSAIYIFRKNFTFPAEFYRCLVFPQCGSWRKVYSGEGLLVILGLTPSGKGENGSGYLSVNIEACSEWQGYSEFTKGTKRPLSGMLCTF